MDRWIDPAVTPVERRRHPQRLRALIGATVDPGVNALNPRVSAQAGL